MSNVTIEELVALARLLERTPLTKVEQLWVAGLLKRLRDGIVGSTADGEGEEES